MSRSLYKPNFVHKSLFLDCLENKQRNILNSKNKVLESLDIDKQKAVPKYFYFWAKSSYINSNLLDNKISIYNGKVFISLNVIKKIIGYKLGAFCITKKKPPHVGKQRQIKKVSRSHEKMVAERKRLVSKSKGNKSKK